MADIVDMSPTVPQHEAATSATATSPPKPVDLEVKQDTRPSVPRGPPLHKVYTLPAPIRTFPLPSFYPSNPLSLFHLLYTWASQILSPPPAEPSTVHQGFWSKETRSVHITDPKSIRALWEQGFFGKGNYSRSEPNWLKREQTRRGKHDGHVAENFTVQRREERKMMKWERARKEQEAIQKTRLAEAWRAPVGPLELLALPNSQYDQPLSSVISPVNGDSAKQALMNGHAIVHHIVDGVGTAEALNGVPVPEATVQQVNGFSLPDKQTLTFPILNGHRPQTPTTGSGDVSPNETAAKRRKSVRFSPKVESTTFQLSDPPSPKYSIQANGKASDTVLPNGSSPSPLSHAVSELTLSEPVLEDQVSEAKPKSTIEIADREHLQLTLEEAFYLVFALGALAITDPLTGKAMTTQELFTLFRRTSYFPPRTTALQPDDPFLIHYAVYHHFRSLGWIARPGIKFGVDWLLYNRGPAFSHAEFAVIVLPAFTDPWWKAQGRKPPQKSWHWLHTINRVQNTALKTLVVVYVDIPPPCDETLDVTGMLERYKIREFIIKRWLSNRSRD